MLSDTVEREIREAVSDPDVTVVVPERAVTIGGWTGYGYAIYGKSTADYRITGGTSGGVVPLGWGQATTATTAWAESYEPVAYETDAIADEEEDCNSDSTAKKWVLTIAAVILIAIAIAILVYTFPYWGAEVGFLAGIGMATGEAAFKIAAWHFYFAMMALVFGWTEDEDC